jgi:hypothetical protein
MLIVVKVSRFPLQRELFRFGVGGFPYNDYCGIFIVSPFFHG